MPGLKSWGVQYNPSMYHALDLSCVCGWSALLNRYHDHVVGFTLDVSPVCEIGAGIIVLECPRCFTKFWFHIRRSSFVETLRDLCSNWPKD